MERWRALGAAKLLVTVAITENLPSEPDQPEKTATPPQVAVTKRRRPSVVPCYTSVKPTC